MRKQLSDKGQTALELLLVSVLIVAMAVMSFRIYSAEGSYTIADAVVRTQADWYISNAGLSYPKCDDTYLTNITINNGEGMRNYTIHTNNPECTRLIFSDDAIKDIQGKITVALDCQYNPDGRCKGIYYKVYPE
ncbi:MAG: hypothetical protein J7K68_03220 [Candidatus Diapherotrites archaeon]|nr:hypothetical protein [Candidatus Diapherotrites archaeon]